ncbi:MAG TPA: glycosyl transferase [Propionibacteriaceae bacterium]
MPLTSDEGRPLVVLQSFPDPRPTTNPYIVMLRDAVDTTDGAELLTFSWRRALTGGYDVFHAHWPEILVSGSSPAKTALRQLMTAALLVRLKLTRTPIVRTWHNLKRPDGISWVQNALLAWFERQTTLLILLNTSTEAPPGKETAIILHGHYRDWFARFPRPAPVPGRFTYFGLIRRYKGVDGLVAAFRELDGEVSLVVAGKPSGVDLEQQLRNLAGRDPRIDLTFAFLSEAELAQVASEGELVVLPYREMHNSGGALAALSLGRPVLVPANEVNARLSDEVGPGWVLTYDDGLSSDDLTRALARVHAGERSERPDLTRRNWDLAGRQHLAAYRRAVTLLRP